MYNDIIAIEQLLYHCCQVVDRGDLDGIMQLFHPQATLDIKWEQSGPHKGSEAIRAWFETYIQTVLSAVKYMRHKIDSPVITVSGSQAVAHSYLTAEAGQKDTGQRIITLGRYADKLCQSDGHWLFEEKVIFMDDVYQV